MNNPPDTAPSTAPDAPFLYWEDFTVGTVREFGRQHVTREEVLAFAGQYDPQPFHLDDAAAQAALFGQLSASGWHTCAMTMGMLVRGLLLQCASLGSPGIEQLRWPKPVFPGDTLRVRSTVLQARLMASRPGVGLVQSQTQTLNQHGDVVLDMQGWGIYRCRPVKG